MSEETPIKIKKIGHVVLSVGDIERSTKFWTEIMGFKVSDRNETGMVFFRNATDHHTIALVPATEKNPFSAPTVTTFSTKDAVGLAVTRASNFMTRMVTR
jgi:catechol-2,3-dioxygenase